MKLFLKLCFLGTAYNGYQVQPNGVTVQGVLNEVTERVFGYPCDIVGCSRTDSGVHAEEFCVTVCKKGEGCLSPTMPIMKIPVAMNSLLPSDIAVFDARMVEGSFHPRYDVKFKEYVYRIWNGEVKNPFYSDRMLMLKKRATNEDVARMNIAAGYFVGRHDFAALMASGSKIVDTVRTVYNASVSEEGNVICFRVAADGFLYNMVRIMVGTLLEVMTDRLLPEDIPTVLDSLDRTRAGHWREATIRSPVSRLPISNSSPVSAISLT